MFSVGIFFFGQYRPLYFNGDNLAETCKRAIDSLALCDDANKLTGWIRDLAETLRSHDSYANVRREHGGINVTIRRGAPVDLGPTLTSYLNGLPHYPRANYDAADVPNF